MSRGDNQRSSRGRNQDRLRVAGGQEYEINYLSRKHNVPRFLVEEAIQSVGNSRQQIEEYILSKTDKKGRPQ